MLPSQPRDKAEMVMPLLSAQDPVAAANSIRRRDWLEGITQAIWENLKWRQT